MERTAASDAFFAEFRSASAIASSDYDVVAFGNSHAMADELVALVESGMKRATASLRLEYGEGLLPLPRVGDHVVVVDSRGVPRLIWRTTEIVVKPLAEVDEAFAWDEGEGDRTLDGWLRGHRHYFAQQAEREGFAMSDQIATVFERFVVVWPAQLADSPAF
jgi:uncharacterized protein YhfF